MLEPVGPYEIPVFGYLLDYQECRVNANVIMSLILFLEQRQQQAFCSFQSNVFLFLYYSLKLIKGVYCHHIPSAIENLCQDIQAMDITSF